MSENSESAGCRPTAIAAGSLVVMALVFMAIGLSLVNQTSCDGACETLGLTFLYAGLPISALFGVGFGELVLAWPLDITFWVVIGFVVAGFATRRNRSSSIYTIVGIAVALIYGLVLSQFVEIAI